MFQKNTSNFVHFVLLDKDTGLGITTGNVSATIFHDGAVYSTATLTPGSNYITGSGVWKYQFSSSAMNANSIALGLTHVDAVPELISINTFEQNTADIYAGITSLQSGVNVTEVSGVAVSGISDFQTNTSGLSTFDAATDMVTVGVVDANIISVGGSGVTIGDFHAQGISATVTGTVNANVIEVGSSGVSGISDFHISTSGLSTFDVSSDQVFVADGGISSASFATNGITAIANGVFNNVVDGSIDFDTVMQMLLAWMAGKVTVTDNGSTRTISFFRRDGTTESFEITVDETDNTEGERSSTGTIT